MRSPRQLILFATLFIAAGAWIGQREVSRNQARQTAQLTAIAVVETAVRNQQTELARTEQEQAALEHAVAAARSSAAAAEAASRMKVWANRIALLKQLLVEMPAHAIPELRLLDAVDWAQIVRTRELDTADNIRSALAAARAAGRRKFMPILQEALKRYTAESAGQLPADIQQLAPHLTTPADLEMLRRYAMIRSGKIDEGNELVIRETASSDMSLSLGLQTWTMNHNASWETPEGGSEAAEMARALTSLETMLGEYDPNGELTREMTSTLTVYQEMFAGLGPQIETTFDEKFGEELKRAIKRFRSARVGATPANIAEVLPYITDADKLVAAARPLLAELEYALDHVGQRATDPAQLQRYLEKPIDQVRLLRDLKLTVDGDRVTMEFSFKTP